jgi:hypothetical protein
MQMKSATNPQSPVPNKHLMLFCLCLLSGNALPVSVFAAAIGWA